jgi:hypothetical protein
MNTIWVKPGEDEIRGGFVALWDNDPAHTEVDPRWAAHGGAYIAGNPANPVYCVAETPSVRAAIKNGRLEKVSAPKPVSAARELEPLPEVITVDDSVVGDDVQSADDADAEETEQPAPKPATKRRGK